MQTYCQLERFLAAATAGRYTSCHSLRYSNASRLLVRILKSLKFPQRYKVTQRTYNKIKGNQKLKQEKQWKPGNKNNNSLVLLFEHIVFHTRARTSTYNFLLLVIRDSIVSSFLFYSRMDFVVREHVDAL